MRAAPGAGTVGAMTSSQVWSAEAAERYDQVEPTGAFDPAVIARTVAFLAELAGGGSAVEFAAGTGRIAVPLCRAGVSVHGIELSEPMAAKLRAKVSAEELPVTLGDMASTGVATDAALVYLVYNTITNLLTQDEQVACFANAAAQLRPGGHFVIECGLPDLRLLPPTAIAVPFDVSAQHLGFDTYELAEQRLTSHHFNREPDGRWRESSGQFRYPWPAEMDLMARLAGMRLVRRVAGWDGAEFTNDSRSAISVWQKNE